MVCLNEDGTIEKVVAAHDVGKAINPLSVEGQIEGGVVMSLGYALTEDFPLDHGKPLAKFGTLGLFRADKTPPVESIIVEENKDPLAYGAVGIGEITSIQRHRQSRAPTTNSTENSVRHCLWKTQHTERVKSKKKNLDKGAEGRAVWSCALKVKIRFSA